MADAAKYIVNSITDFSNGVVHTAGDVLSRSLATQEAQTNAVLDFGKNALAASPATPAAASQNIISSLNLSTLKIPLLIGGALLVFLILKKK